jgi:hypothetical protein
MIDKKHIPLCALNLPSPIYFPSISSVKTALAPSEYANIMLHLRKVYPYYLVSAYDIFNASMGITNFIEEIDNAISKGITILMDSGNYESYWKTSDWSQNDFHSVLSRSPCPLVFCFDIQTPPQDIGKHKGIILSNWQEDVKSSNGNILIPIIHGRKESIPELCKYIASETDSEIIAVPERRLGDGIIERAHTVAKIRSALNENGKYTKLHLLGTGNPISIAVYSIMGADSFDGLEWCQTVVDPDTAFLFHFSQAELFFDRGRYGNEDLPFVLKTLAHNLEFYSNWMRQLQDVIRSDTAIEFCENHFSPNVYFKLSNSLCWRKST